MRKDFYIFRHGQSTYNLQGRTQGQTNDSVLTDLGKQQALEVGKKLSDKSIEVIITSPLLRAVETANLANKTLKVDVYDDAHFIEVNVGEIEGLHFTEIIKKYGEKYQQWRSLSPVFENVCFEGGETKKQVRERVFSGLKDYVLNSKYKKIAISSHGIMLTQILLYLGFENVSVENGAILHITYDNEKWSFEEFL